MQTPTEAEARTLLAEAIAHARTLIPPQSIEGRGIVICAGGERYLTNAWVCINMLRHVGCKLPIQIWYLGAEEMPDHWIPLLRDIDVGVVDARSIHPRPRILNGWEAKPFAIIHSPWREVLLLDADNIAIKDPTFLFEEPAYREHGAIFWPDISETHPTRRVWELTGITYRPEPEIESGQVVVDKQRCWRSLYLTMHLNSYSDFWYEYVYGDKDTFRFAWKMMDQEYAVPATGVDHRDGVLYQHDFEGNRLFQHRHAHKWARHENTSIPNFVWEPDCLEYIEQLNQKLSGGNPNTSAEYRSAVQELIEQRHFIYSRIGHDQRDIELLRYGVIGKGCGGCEQMWKVEECNGQVMLCFIGKDGVICKLTREDADVWRGNWLNHERMPIALIPRTYPECPVTLRENADLSIAGLELENVGDFPFYFRPQTWDRDILSEVVTRDCYRLTELVGRKAPSMIVDVGAHIGSFTRWVKHLWPKARVVAYEPVPSNFLLLARNTAFISDVTCRMYALDEHLGVARIPETANTGGGAVGAEGTPVLTLDAAAAFGLEQFSEIDILKLDCEGGERSILRSLRASGLLKRVKQIVGEWHGIHRAEIERLSDDFDVTTLDHGNLGYFWAARKRSS